MTLLRKPLLCAVLVILSGTTTYGQVYDWPLRSRIDLSSGFGELRTNRFHAGIDLRTGGKTGLHVYSPVDGYVWRIKMSYEGSGKGLYIKTEDDLVFVLYHLEDFNTRIRQVVRKAQNAAGRYYVDSYFPPDSIKVSKGELVAFSGVTGTSAPHLHFELRNPQNQPINPLNNGYNLDDRVRPVFERIGFELVDDHSLLMNGQRSVILPVHSGTQEGSYHLDTMLYFDSPFGVLADCFDRMRPGGMRQSVYKVSLLIDGKLLYESKFDTLDFTIGRSANLEYDLLSAAEGEKRVRRLYHRPGNEYSGSHATDEHRGLIGNTSELTEGVHEAIVIGEDAFGNRSELHFRFLWGPASVQAPFNSDTVEKELTYQIVEDGLIVVSSPTADILEFYAEGLLLGTETPDRRLNDGRQCFFVTPRQEYRWVDSLAAKAAGDNVVIGVLSLHLVTVGYNESETITIDSSLSIHSGNRNFYQPRFVAMEQVDEFGLVDVLNSRVYRILPDAFVTARAFDVSLSLLPDSEHSEKTGLCWWDKKDREWIWLSNSEYNPHSVTASSEGGGMFAAVYDTASPSISKLNLRQGDTVSSDCVFSFVLKDELSGIENDQSIDVRVNGQWLIPEYHPPTGRCIAASYEPLSSGPHELTITVEDRASNKAGLSREFHVR